MNDIGKKTNMTEILIAVEYPINLRGCLDAGTEMSKKQMNVKRVGLIYVSVKQAFWVVGGKMTSFPTNHKREREQKLRKRKSAPTPLKNSKFLSPNKTLHLTFHLGEMVATWHSQMVLSPNGISYVFMTNFC